MTTLQIFLITVPIIVFISIFAIIIINIKTRKITKQIKDGTYKEKEKKDRKK